MDPQNGREYSLNYIGRQTLGPLLDGEIQSATVSDSAVYHIQGRMGMKPFFYRIDTRLKRAEKSDSTVLWNRQIMHMEPNH